jgi:hypothetical protein
VLSLYADHIAWHIFDDHVNYKFKSYNLILHLIPIYLILFI